jgi:hypothetical protein
MNDLTAAAARRGAVAIGALGITLGAHVLSGTGARPAALAPLLWLAIVAVAVLPRPGSRREARFAPWGLGRLAATLAVSQVAAHLVLVGAPWALGLVEAQHPCAAITPTAVAVHMTGGLLLAVLLRRGEAWTLRALRGMATLLGLPEPRPRRTGSVLVRPHARPLASRTAAGPRSTRGPPLGLLTT